MCWTRPPPKITVATTQSINKQKLLAGQAQAPFQQMQDVVGFFPRSLLPALLSCCLGKPHGKCELEWSALKGDCSCIQATICLTLVVKGCFPHPLQCACSPAIHNAFFPYDSSQGVEQKPALQAGLVYGVFLLMSPGLWLFWGGSWQCGGFPSSLSPQGASQPLQGCLPVLVVCPWGVSYLRISQTCLQ